MYTSAAALSAAILRTVCCLLVSSTVLATATATATAQPPTVSWAGRIISATGSNGTNTWTAYRKSIELDAAPTTATARIACDSKYWLWVNGKLVVFEGGLKRGPNPRDSYFDQIDLKPHLQSGNNTLAVLVWHFGREGMSHKNSGQAGLLFDASIEGQPLVSDASWKAKLHPAYGQASGPGPNWRLPESNLAYDARLALDDWQLAAFDDSNWPSANASGYKADGPWGELHERPIPQWKTTELMPYENADTLPAVSTGEPVIAKLPYNAQVTPYLEIEAPAGLEIDIRTDNFRGGGEPNVRSSYTTRQGRQAYESLGWMNGHEVIYTVPAGVKIMALKYRESGYRTQLTPLFKCDDERLNALWEKAQRTLYVNMRDTYFDCPGRERAQWWGDVTLELQQAFYGLDRQSDQLSRKAILELANWQKPTGELFSPCPAGNWDKELPMQMLASVGRYGFWEYYRQTADRQTIETVYPMVGRYLSLWQLSEEAATKDLVIPRQGAWTWGDWGTNKDLPLLYNAWYYLALDGQANMALLVGDQAQHDECRQAQQRLAIAFNAAFWTAEGYRSPDHKGPIDDRGNALAVVSGLADREKYPVITQVLTTEQHASPYMEKYVLQALVEIGEVDAALDRMLDRFGPMIDSPITTLWEGWGIGSAGYGGGSYNHAWSGGPLTILSQMIAGMNVDSQRSTPDLLHYRIEPQLGRLKNLSASVLTKHGELAFEIDDSESQLAGEVVVPESTEVTLVLPYGSSKPFEWIGIEIAPATNEEGESTISLPLKTGTHRFRVTH